MKCPNCEETLVMADRHGIEIDYCPKCRGVWLDKGELDKIIERSELSSSNIHDSKEDEHYDDFDSHRQYDQSHQNRRKRGGFLSNLFDFD